jgi:hypothetical protein
MGDLIVHGFRLVGVWKECEAVPWLGLAVDSFNRFAVLVDASPGQTFYFLSTHMPASEYE